MLSICDDYECKNGIITVYYDESDEVLETYKCEECDTLNKLGEKYDWNFTWTYDHQGRVVLLEGKE